MCRIFHTTCYFVHTAYVPVAKNVLNILDGPNINNAWMTKNILLLTLDILKCLFQKQTILSFVRFEHSGRVCHRPCTFHLYQHVAVPFTNSMVYTFNNNQNETRLACEF